MFDAVGVFLEVIYRMSDFLFCIPLISFNNVAVSFGDFIVAVAIFSICVRFLYGRIVK